MNGSTAICFPDKYTDCVLKSKSSKCVWNWVGHVKLVCISHNKQPDEGFICLRVVSVNYIHLLTNLLVAGEIPRTPPLKKNVKTRSWASVMVHSISRPPYWLTWPPKGSRENSGVLLPSVCPWCNYKLADEIGCFKNVFTVMWVVVICYFHPCRELPPQIYAYCFWFYGSQLFRLHSCCFDHYWESFNKLTVHYLSST